jgi:hypothetical protein
MLKHIIYIFLGMSLSGCEDKKQAVPYKDIPSINAKDPVGVFCRPDCSGCDFDVNRCKQMVQSNLASLCENSSENNCYTTWLKYSQTCEYLCHPNDPNLASQAELVNITFTEDFSI